jgi:hypothetical protein
MRGLPDFPLLLIPGDAIQFLAMTGTDPLQPDQLHHLDASIVERRTEFFRQKEVASREAITAQIIPCIKTL